MRKSYPNTWYLTSQNFYTVHILLMSTFVSNMGQNLSDSGCEQGKCTMFVCTISVYNVSFVRKPETDTGRQTGERYHTYTCFISIALKQQEDTLTKYSFLYN